MLAKSQHFLFKHNTSRIIHWITKRTHLSSAFGMKRKIATVKWSPGVVQSTTLVEISAYIFRI
jgi:hypothetical protein